VKKDLKDCCIINELALDKREWKLAIHVPEPSSSVTSFLLSSVKVSPPPPAIFTFFGLAFYCLSSFCRIGFFIILRFPLLFQHCFIPVSLTHVISSLSYLNLLGTRRLSSSSCCYLRFSRSEQAWSHWAWSSET
jgi:hypothetical protein